MALEPQSLEEAGATHIRGARLDRRDALDALVPIVYDTLRRIARQQLAGKQRLYRK